jgi:hypothetical protein
VRILCGGAQCGEYLGDVGPSTVQMNPRPVWRIRPGWCWVFPPGVRGQPLHTAILERADAEGRSERRLLHEIYGASPAIRTALARNPGVGVAREAPLPIVVRCSKCHRLRYVPADVVTRPLQPPQRRLVRIGS